MIPALAVNTAGGAATPLTYGTALKFFPTAGAGTSGSGSSFTWTDQSAAAEVLSVPGGDDGPVLNATYQNGLPGVVFSGSLDTRLLATAAFLDNFFSGGGTKGIAFAAKADTLTIGGTSSATLIEKGFYGTGAGQTGWAIELFTSGLFRFAHQNSNDGNMRIEASGFYSAGDLVLGYLTYNGGFASNSITMTLWNGSSFVDTGSITIPGNGTTLGTDTSKDLCVGNNSRQGAGGFNAPWSGGIMDIWITNPANSSADQNYLRRYIP